MLLLLARLCLLLQLVQFGLGELRRSKATALPTSHRAYVPPELHSPSKSYQSYIKQFGVSEESSAGAASSSSTIPTNYTSKTYCINETDVKYDYKGNVSIYETFATCLRNTPDALLAPFYSDGETINVTSINILNNFISVNELENIVNFDIFLVITWRDPRLNMPGLWTSVDGKVQQFGVDITQAFYEQNINQDALRFWLPDIFFPEVSDETTTSESLLAFPLGIFVWTRHMIIEFLNSDLKYTNYPDDEQTIALRYLSFALPTNQLQMYLPNDTPSVVFFNNVAGQKAFTTNSIWEFIDANAYTQNPSREIDYQGTSYDFEYRSFSVLEFRIKRNSTGIVTRLAFPIFLLIFLAGLIFWAKFDDRLDFTVTILLAVSSLYIVIFQTIPMIGYLTTLDKYITQMFTTLFVCAGVHQFILRLKQNDSDVTWPLRRFYIRFLEAIGRVVVIPFIFIRYFTSFTQFYDFKTLIASGFFVFLFAFIIALMEGKQVYLCFVSVIDTLKQRLDDNNSKEDRSNMEFLVLNLYLFNKVSFGRNFYATYAETRDRLKMEAVRVNQLKQEDLVLRAGKTQGFARVDKVVAGVPYNTDLNSIELSDARVVNNQLHSNNNY